MHPKMCFRHVYVQLACHTTAMYQSCSVRHHYQTKLPRSTCHPLHYQAPSSSLPKTTKGVPLRHAAAVIGSDLTASLRYLFEVRLLRTFVRCGDFRLCRLAGILGFSEIGMLYSNQNTSIPGPGKLHDRRLRASKIHCPRSSARLRTRCCRRRGVAEDEDEAPDGVPVHKQASPSPELGSRLTMRRQGRWMRDFPGPLHQWRGPTRRFGMQQDHRRTSPRSLS